MGTSGSNKGPGPGVPFDPPWLDDIEIPEPDEGPPQEEETQDDQTDSPTDLAPSRRFANARRSIGEFARNGRKAAFKRAVGHYSRTGMGGARNVANRMRTSARSGANVISFLQAAREKTNPTINEWVSSLLAQKASAQEIAIEIARYTMPTGGSQDEASAQQSMANAMQDLLMNDPDVDLFNMDDDSIWTLIESFLSYEAFYRLSMDIGQVFEDSVLTPLESVTRMNEMRDYLKAELSVQVELLRRDEHNTTSEQLQSVLQQALENTFIVYERAI